MRDHRQTSGVMLATLTLCAVQLMGCGGSGRDERTAPVAGKITYRGKPLPHGQVVMIHDSGQMAAAEVRPDGSYELKAPVGSNRVMIQCTDMPNLSQISPKSGQALRIPKSLIPVRYTDYASSSLTIDVVDGENTKDWELKD